MIKINRAELHHQSIHTEFARLFPRERKLVTPEIYDGGLTHVYRANDPPPWEGVFSPMVGDCVHNLRSALDHLAHQLVLVSRGTPNTRTQFPILDKPPVEKVCWFKKQTLPTISGGVTTDIRKALEVVQPYNRRDLKHGLGLLRDLDNIDKHRNLLVTVTGLSAHVTSFAVGSPTAPPGEPTTVWTRKPLKHGEVMAVLKYPQPYLQPDPNLQFTPHISFGKGERAAGEFVPVVLVELINLVNNEMLLNFAPFFAK